MASPTDWKAPGTAANADRDGKLDWTDWDNVKTDDSDYAIDEPAKNDYGDWLRLTNFGFTTTDIPVGSTINGIEVQYKKSNLGSSELYLYDSVLKLRKTSGQVGDNKASGTRWATTKETKTYGGAADTWNSELTAADLIDSGFGIDLSVNTTGDIPDTAWVYFCQIRVYYTEAEVVIPFRNYYPHILPH